MDSKMFSRQLGAFYRRRKKILLPLLSLAILFAGYYGFIKDQWYLYAQNLDLVGELDQRIAKADQIIFSSKQYEKRMIELTPAEKKLISMSLSEKPEYPSLIVQLTSVARKSGFFVTSMDIEDLGSQSIKENNNKELGKLLVKIKLVGGGYNELKSLVSLLQESVMANDIYSINFSSKNSVYDMTLVVYYANPNISKK